MDAAKGNLEGVTLCVDLVPAMLGNCLSHDLVVDVLQLHAAKPGHSAAPAQRGRRSSQHTCCSHGVQHACDVAFEVWLETK